MTGYTDEAINDNVRACIDHMIKKLKETEIED